MKPTTSFAAALAVMLAAGAARAEDAQPTGKHDPQHDGMPAQRRNAVRAAMHDAMQKQMAAPPMAAQMPGMPDRASDDAVAARERAAHVQRERDAARQRAMERGTRDAAMARGAVRGGMQNGTEHGGGMMPGDANAQQQGAGMMRTGTMHGGSDGMMPGGGGDKGPMPGMPGGMGSSGPGTTSASQGTGAPGGEMMKH